MSFSFSFLLFLSFFSFYYFLIYLNRFPCSIGDCKKEYRTQWELNSHRRTKHADEPINPNDDQGLVNELPRQLLNDGSDCRKFSPQKTRNKQKIIYVLPGPQSNYVSLVRMIFFWLWIFPFSNDFQFSVRQTPGENTPIDRNMCFDSQTIVRSSEVDHNYLRTTGEYAMPINENTKVSSNNGQSLLKSQLPTNDVSFNQNL